MTTDIQTETGTVEAPTATEFIPADEVPEPNRTGTAMVRGVRRVTDGKGLEVTYHEPHDDDVENHVYVCDECGQAEEQETNIEWHLRTEHEN